MSCEPDSQNLKPNMDLLKKELNSNQIIEKEEPFVSRQFDPYLNGKWIGNAVSYGCYRKGQSPGGLGPSEEEILEDLQIIARYWNLIRVYGADDATGHILKVIKDNNLPIRVMIGIWLENEHENPERKNSNITETLRGIELVNEYMDYIVAVNVGNETQVFWSWHRMNVEDLIRYIRVVRNNTMVPVTTADDYNFWNKPESHLVADEIDFIVTHMYALWNGQILENASQWMDQTYLEVKKMHPGKSILVGETGWATNYNPDKKGPGEQGSLVKGEVSVRAQEQYLIIHNAWVNKNKITTFLFEVFDEPWKGGGENSGPNEVEKHWGVFYENRTPKESFQKYLKYISNKSG
jgi:exo-beta-1,3-glucanase (GH17 family)